MREGQEGGSCKGGMEGRLPQERNQGKGSRQDPSSRHISPPCPHKQPVSPSQIHLLMALSVGTGQWANPLKSSLPSCPIISQSWQLMETKRQHIRLLGITLDSSRNTVFCYHSQAIHFPPTLHCGMVFSPQLLVLITWGDITSHLDLKKSKNVLHLIAFDG